MSLVNIDPRKAAPFPEAAAELLRDTQLRKNVAHATDVIQGKRAALVAEKEDWQALRSAGAAIRKAALLHLDTYLEQFEQQFTRAGGHVHWAADAEEAQRIVLSLLREAQAAEVIKIKSMTTAEIDLNHSLEANGIRAYETDLAELILQLGEDLQGGYERWARLTLENTDCVGEQCLCGTGAVVLEVEGGEADFGVCALLRNKADLALLQREQALIFVDGAFEVTRFFQRICQLLEVERGSLGFDAGDGAVNLEGLAQKVLRFGMIPHLPEQDAKLGAHVGGFEMFGAWIFIHFERRFAVAEGFLKSRRGFSHAAAFCERSSDPAGILA